MRPTIDDEHAQTLQQRVDELVRVDASDLTVNEQLRILLEEYNEHRQQQQLQGQRQPNTMPRR